MTKKTLNVGDRVYMVHMPDQLGTIVNKPYITPKGTRQAVRWDFSGMVTEWDPAFFYPEETPWDEIPERIVSGEYVFDKQADNTGRLFKILDKIDSHPDLAVLRLQRTAKVNEMKRLQDEGVKQADEAIQTLVQDIEALNRQYEILRNELEKKEGGETDARPRSNYPL